MSAIDISLIARPSAGSSSVQKRRRRRRRNCSRRIISASSRFERFRTHAKMTYNSIYKTMMDREIR